MYGSGRLQNMYSDLFLTLYVISVTCYLKLKETSSVNLIPITLDDMHKVNIHLKFVYIKQYLYITTSTHVNIIPRTDNSYLFSILLFITNFDSTLKSNSDSGLDLYSNIVLGYL